MRMRPLVLAGAAILAAAPAVASAAWSAPVRVAPADRAAYSTPAVAVGDRGDAVAAWIRTPQGARGAGGRVQLATRATAAARWSRPRVLSGPGAALPRVALGGRSVAAAAWTNSLQVVGALRAGRSGPWRPAPVATAGGPVQDLRVAVDRSGRPIVLWSERRGSRYVVRLATRASARAPWVVRPARLSVPGPAAPTLALSAGRGALVAWVERGRVWASRTVGEAFERGVALSATGAGTPAAALSPQGAALASWGVRLPGGTPVLLATDRGSAGVGWGRATDLGIGAGPVAAIDDRGDAVVAWSLGDPGGAQGIDAATRRGRGGWEATTILGRRDCACTLSVADAAIDGTGTPLVAWRRADRRGPGRGGVAALVPGSLDWSVPAVVTRRAIAGLAVGAGPARGAVALWVEQGPGGVRALSLRP